MTDLEQRVKDYADAYYRGEEIISDAEYDALVKQLRKEHPESDFFKGEILGDDLKGVSKKYKLPITMNSLAKCNTEEEMLDWWNKHPHTNILAELKIDGNSQCLCYKNGQFVQSLSRGNGVYGEDSTANVSRVQGVIKSLPVKHDFTGEIRGEVNMTRSIFDKYFKDSGKKNPRNMAAGIMGRLDGSDCDKLQFIAYDVFDANNTVDTTEIRKLKFLEENGFTIPEFKINPSFEEILEWKNSLTNKSEIPCDGIVIKQNVTDKADLMKLVPVNNVAFKPNLEKACTKVKQIAWSMRGTRLSPVIWIEPVELEGTTVVKASVSNINKMKRLGIYEGAEVIVSKHGMIIPQIDLVVNPKPDAFEVPKVCPVCGEPLTITDTGTFPECTNPNCARKIAHKYLRMFGILGILGTGRAFVAELEEQGIGYPAFFEMLDKGPSDVLNEYAGGINGEKIFVQMNNARKQPITPAKFLALFDYDGLAEKQFQKLGNLELKDILKLSEADLKGMKGIGDETAAAMIDFFNKDMEEILIVSKYFDIKVMEVSAEDSDKPTVCFTGACPGYSRKELAELARGKYTVMDGVNKDLNILVCADPNSGSGKLKKAESLGIKLMSYDDFLATLNL